MHQRLTRQTRTRWQIRHAQRCGAAKLSCALIAGLCAMTPSAWAQDATPADAPRARDASPPTKPAVTQPVYPVTTFKIGFDQDVDPLGLTPAKLRAQPIELALVDGVYTRPQPGAMPIKTTLAELQTDKPRRYDVTALRTIIDDLLAYLGEESDLVGIIVAPSPDDIGLDLEDRRTERTDLTLIVRLAQVGRVRTLASGDRIDTEAREDHPLHARIRERSPLKAGEADEDGDGAVDGDGSFIVRSELDDYLYRLNRHPGRRVDAAVSPGLTPGDVSLDYLVSENKPWYAYFQLSNTGTDSTDKIRERFGFVHNQLTNRDDILSIDYLTTGFDESHAVRLGYTRPLTERLEARFTGLYSEFTADQVGSPLSFTGEDAAAGASLAYNFYQDGPLFLDAVGGLEYYFTSANNPAAATEGEAHFLMGSLGVEMERRTDLSQLYGSLMLRGSLNQEDSSDLAALGRTAPDSQFMMLDYALTGSLYLEPVLNRAAWEDISDPSSSTLAHELAFALRGQWAVADDRFVPTFQAVAGGLNTVRGYEQATVAGDSSVVGSLEYRFHVPRVFGIEAPQQTRLFDRPFRFAPDAVYGRPDWDLVLKGFFDVGYVDTTDELAFETDETLMSTGLGVDLSLKNNVSLRADWGVALQDAGSSETGDNRFHFVLTLLY